MSKPFLTFLLACSLLAGFSLTGCGTSEEKQTDVEEKTPPDTIQLSTEATSGFTTETVQTRSVKGEISTTGAIKANEDRVFHINSFVSGRVAKDNVFLGNTIKRGQTLAVVQNLEVAKVQAEYIHELHNNEVEIAQAKTRYALAQKNLAREKRLLAEGISPQKDYQQAEADASLAHSALEGQKEHRIHINAEGKALLGAYGMSPGKVHSESIRTGSPVTAPRSGIITKKNITLGDMVTPETLMYEVSDLSQVWLDITVFPKDLASVRMGQQVTFMSDSLPEKTFTGHINYLQPSTTDASQTYVARAYLNNGSGQLKPGMFGQVHLDLATPQNKPFVPEAAVQKYGKETFVFVKLGHGRFQKRTIQLGNTVTGGYLVNEGIEAGNQIVVNGSFTLKAEMLKSQFAEEE